MNKDTANIKKLLNFEFNVFKATFLDVDSSNSESERYFSSEEKALKWILKMAQYCDIEPGNIKWEGTPTKNRYFNYQFRNHPDQGDSCYYGSYCEIDID